MAGSEQQTSQVTAEQSTSDPILPNAIANPSKTAAQNFARPNKRPRLEAPFSMTAAAAIAEARQSSKSPGVSAAPGSTQTSPNPAAQALGALMGVSQNAVSQAYTPTTTKVSDPTKILSEGVGIAAEHMQPRTADNSLSSTDQNVQTSPTSATSFDTHDSIAAPSGIGTGTTVASPQPIETTPQPAAPAAATEATSPDNTTSGLNFSTPLLTPQPNSERRGMSLPHSGLRQNTRSPSSRRHRCPYCATEFTRHHNLKSHLLTHSHEKPFVCSTCQQRFRRLHDLKRHTKLHTGERPHVCPKCNRKFARGDALARHTKGPGGCAGRRASLSSFAGEDDYEGADDMDGVVYNEPESMEDLEGDALRGTPSIRRQPPSGDDTMDNEEYHSRMASTYPPLQGRPPGGIASGTFPPRTTYGTSSNTASSAASNSGPPQLPYPASGSSAGLRPHSGSQSGPQLFAPNPLTESPKPISPSQPQSRIPGAGDGRIQSPNMNQFQPPQPFGRAANGPGPTHTGSSVAPQLPPPHGLNPPDSRFTLASQGGLAHPPTQPSGPPTHMSGSGPLSSHSNSLSSHGHGSGENANSMFGKDERIWAVVKDLEKRVTSMQDEINSLKSQLAAATAQQLARA